ncbi:MAG: hypothetical protein BWX98_02344 [Candidatus Aminicenantes bacterium ADurb.Bin147]|nr:MAG: hypothetical protein BWX98_02344 [Candidatus Aminicenantes bacterium ADurb.Bin147]
MVAHAQRTPRNLRPGPHLGIDRVVPFHFQPGLVHFRRRRQPDLGRRAAGLVEDPSGRPEMADVRHAGADEDLVDLVAGDLREELDVVGIVGTSQERLGDIGQVNLEDGRVRSAVDGLLIPLDQRRLGQPGLDRGDPPPEGFGVSVALFDHLGHQGDVAPQVPGHLVPGQGDDRPGRRPFGRGVRQLISLVDGQIRQPFHLQDPAVEDVDLSFLGDGEQPPPDGEVRNGVDRVPQRQAGIELPLEADQDGLGHVKGHEAEGSGERHEPRTGRKAQADREAGVGIAARSHRVRQQKTVEPGMDHAVARPQRNAFPLGDEAGQEPVHLDVGRLRISRRVAERLHEKIGLEFQAGELLQLVGGHGAGRVLGADGRHFRLARRTREHAVHAASPADDLLGLRERLSLFRLGIADRDKERRLGEAKGRPRFLGQGPADDQVKTAARPELVLDRRRLELEGREKGAGGRHDRPLFKIEDDRLAGVHPRDVDVLDRQAAGILGGVEEDRGDQASEDDAAAALVGNEGNVLPDMPHDRVAGGLARRARADDVADEGHPLVFSPESGDGGRAVRKPRPAHGQGVERDVRSRGGLLGRGKIVGVDFPVHLVDRQGQGLGEGGAAEKPFAFGPGFQDAGGRRIRRGQGGDSIERRVNENRPLQGFGRGLGQGGNSEKFDERTDIVAADHRPQEKNGLFGRNDGRGLPAAGDVGQPGRLDSGRGIDARRNAVPEKGEKPVGLAGRRGFEQTADFGRILRIQRQGRNAQGPAFVGVLEIMIQHRGGSLRT